MKLYVCYGTFSTGRRLHPHPCEVAHSALTAAGHDPDVVKTYGLGPLPDFVNDLTPRRQVRALTGQYWVPVLQLDDGTAIRGSQPIAQWARSHPAPSPGPPTG